MDLRKAYKLTKTFSSNSHHYGRVEYTPKLTDEIKFVQQNGRELVIYLNILREGVNHFKMRFGEAYGFINKIISKDFIPDGSKIPNKVYTSEGLVDSSKFKEAKDFLNSLPKPIDYEIYLGESLQTRELYDGVYFLETGETVLHFKVLTDDKFPTETYNRMYQYAGKRVFIKVILNEDNKFEAVGEIRVKTTKDKFLSAYPNAVLEEELEKFIQNNVKD